MAKLIPLYQYAGQDLGIMGLGKSGMATARALAGTGTRVHAWDDSPILRDAARAESVPLCDLTDQTSRNSPWPALQGVVWSPGIPHTFPQPHPVAVIAHERGVPLFCDIDLLARARQDSFFLGITGTNGKSTTTALIGHILKAARHPVQVGGNLGTPALSFEPLPFHGTYVLELSSYQLELVPSLCCDVAVLLNITPDHLARHGGMDGYIAAKRQIFRCGPRPGVAVVCIDDEPSLAIHDALCRENGRKVVAVSTRALPRGGVGAVDGQLVDATQGRPRAVADLTTIATLPGAHNWQNAAAAYAACRQHGIDAKIIVEAMASFPGLPHRQELVAEIDGVRFINDSKATNADAADKALRCYDTVYWIAGGQPKEGGIVSLEPHFRRMRQAYLIGQAAPAFERTLKGKVPLSQVGTLARAVTEAAKAAWRDAIPGAVVLLSPACASWDQFSSFEHRGDIFRELVADLAHTRAAAKPGGRR
ncbi:UDP-N-acetylmuramoyl-L-alanine--D-glutamate ligase [Rhodospirillum rubrum]|uniref:UDP-N-acetylmuramoyl-L-alanine--D-glutamate ligase n=1 Tax=Rhodospirillum rubrum TaxID=1085 RepID=UPI0019069E27|nr:UDP-N-acetylmuramoyl-L-alanine--D-glutamate ligase [Rhodospirillum rubrum]MBK1663973.1 UDP-N-acetylmuramoyl-L-alanine--D-glutamate ligase [Rhodospirillum rubrum]MBK1677533.1 UDP-N-acetylmuramoyl-L-alanine--D-glutamate ligase [Rhodospirillum rubrum]